MASEICGWILHGPDWSGQNCTCTALLNRGWQGSEFTYACGSAAWADGCEAATLSFCPPQVRQIRLLEPHSSEQALAALRCPCPGSPRHTGLGEVFLQLWAPTCSFPHSPWAVPSRGTGSHRPTLCCSVLSGWCFSQVSVNQKWESNSMIISPRPGASSSSSSSSVIWRRAVKLAGQCSVKSALAPCLVLEDRCYLIYRGD